jgi:hypothetical protein
MAINWSEYRSVLGDRIGHGTKGEYRVVERHPVITDGTEGPTWMLLIKGPRMDRYLTNAVGCESVDEAKSLAAEFEAGERA